MTAPPLIVGPAAADAVRSGLIRLGDHPALTAAQSTWNGTQLLTASSTDTTATPGAGGALLARLALGAQVTAPAAEVLVAALAEPNARTAVLTPTVGVGGDVALTSWAAGTNVYCGHGDGPAVVVRELERCGATVAVVPLATLRALPDEPAALMADLSELQLLLYDAADGMLTDSQERAVRDTLGITPRGVLSGSASSEGAVIARLVRACTGVGDVRVDRGRDSWSVRVTPVRRHAHADPAGDAALAGSVQSAADKAISTMNAEAALDALRCLDRTALLSMLAALDRCGDTLADTPHKALVRRWHTVLAAQNLATPDSAALERAWRDTAQRWRVAVGGTGTIDYARRTCDRLPELLRGEVQAVHLLFPKGDATAAEALYRESITARYQHHGVAAAVAEIVRRRPGPVRVLEVGAGTGATTDAVLPELAGLPVDYLFTDVSRYFIDRARPVRGLSLGPVRDLRHGRS
ncbi:hypothetical protein EDC02_2346 [Micromonospora sp. Llam0]|uniref:class I SAM-dependent methyltransferase n=1 Tax=Micromonospora sp. Llam0 TaxID=2485143 RepID=UPI000F4897F1|nr:class I SAM-dependent methyltransferase [Micromonospora sp. Llam0]ROO60466.1 hypothetical protein EDC02_2346 [Micromonospora sp. Llam0]